VVLLPRSNISFLFNEVGFRFEPVKMKYLVSLLIRVCAKCATKFLQLCRNARCGILGNCCLREAGARRLVVDAILLMRSQDACLLSRDAVTYSPRNPLFLGSRYVNVHVWPVSPGKIPWIPRRRARLTS
jgi:hypothetical protein